MRKKKHPEHVNHERWLVSYADFITLLFAFFVVMFAVSQVDSKKVGRFTEAQALAAEALAELAASGGLAAAVCSPADAMSGVPARALDAAEASAVAAGRPLAATGVTGPIAGIGPDGRLLAVLQDVAGQARPRLVLA